ncbi:hypothetical protein GN956_G8520 [Arapaima gigas]
MRLSAACWMERASPHPQKEGLDHSSEEDIEKRAQRGSFKKERGTEAEKEREGERELGKARIEQERRGQRSERESEGGREGAAAHWWRAGPIAHSQQLRNAAPGKLKKRRNWGEKCAE